MLGMDVTSELLGNTYHPSNIFSHTLDLENAIFDDYVDNISNKKILLDRILVSPLHRPKVTSFNIEYRKYDTLVDNPRRRDGRPTYHRPITLELESI